MTYGEWKAQGFYVMKGERSRLREVTGEAMFLPSQVAPGWGNSSSMVTYGSDEAIPLHEKIRRGDNEDARRAELVRSGVPHPTFAAQDAEEAWRQKQPFDLKRGSKQHKKKSPSKDVIGMVLDI